MSADLDAARAPVYPTDVIDTTGWAIVPTYEDQMAAMPASTLAFQPVLNTLNVAVQYLQSAQVLFEIYNVYKATGWDLNGMIGVASAFYNWWNLYKRDQSHQGVTISGARLKEMSTQTGLVYDAPFTGNVAGTKTGNNEPLNVTARVGWKGSNAGRWSSGGTNHIGLTEGDINDSILNPIPATALVNAYQQLLPLVNVGGSRLVVVSRWLNNAKRPSGVVSGILTARLADRIVDSQRRRLPGRGA